MLNKGATTVHQQPWPRRLRGSTSIPGIERASSRSIVSSELRPVGAGSPASDRAHRHRRNSASFARGRQPETCRPSSLTAPVTLSSCSPQHRHFAELRSISPPEQCSMSAGPRLLLRRVHSAAQAAQRQDIRHFRLDPRHGQARQPRVDRRIRRRLDPPSPITMWTPRRSDGTPNRSRLRTTMPA